MFPDGWHHKYLLTYQFYHNTRSWRASRNTHAKHCLQFTRLYVCITSPSNPICETDKTNKKTRKTCKKCRQPSQQECVPRASRAVRYSIRRYQVNKTIGGNLTILWKPTNSCHSHHKRSHLYYKLKIRIHYLTSIILCLDDFLIGRKWKILIFQETKKTKRDSFLQ